MFLCFLSLFFFCLGFVLLFFVALSLFCYWIVGSGEVAQRATSPDP